MAFYIVQVLAPVFWAIPINWPGQKFVDLQLTVHSPLRAGKIHDSETAHRFSDSSIAMVQRNFFVLEADLTPAAMLVKFTILVDRLRCIVGQSRMTANYAGLATVDKLPDEEPLQIETTPVGNRLYSPRFWSTPLTKKNINEAAVSSALPPSFLFLCDASAAFLNNDYVRTILYSAFAVESISLTVLDQTYDLERNREQSPTTLRIVKDGGSAELRDPVFAFLRERGKFLNMLHELPLYLVGKSLLFENSSNYQTAAALYKTRNMLAHLAIVPDEDKYLTTDANGAEKALRCAVEIFGWWGYPVERFLAPLSAEFLDSSFFAEAIEPT